MKFFSFLNTKLLYGEAFKAPTVFQIYDEFRGNRDLKPQTIKTYEMENSLTFFQNLNIKLGYFMSQLNGLIAEGRNPDPYAPATRTTIFQNFKPTHIYGFLGELDFQIQRYFKLFGNYTITNDRDRKTNFEFQADPSGRITGVSPVYDGKEIDNIAERKANLGIHWNFWKTMHLNLRLNWVGRRKAPVSNKYFQPIDLDFWNRRYPYQTEGKPDGYLSGYTIINMTYSYNNIFGWNGLDFQIIVRNLLNKPFVGMGRQSGNAVRPIDEIQPQIRNPDGFVSPYHPQPGREIFLQVGYTF